MLPRLGAWLVRFWHATDWRPSVDPIVDRRIKETEWGLTIARDLQYHSRAGNVRALQHAAYLLDLPTYHVVEHEDQKMEISR